MDLIVELIGGMSRETYVSQAANASSFEVLIVQFVNGDFEVSGCLEFHEASAVSTITLSE